MLVVTDTAASTSFSKEERGGGNLELIFFSFLWMYIHRMSSEFILKALESITTDPQYFIIIKNEGE